MPGPLRAIAYMVRYDVDNSGLFFEGVVVKESYEPLLNMHAGCFEANQIGRSTPVFSIYMPLVSCIDGTYWPG